MFALEVIYNGKLSQSDPRKLRLELMSKKTFIYIFNIDLPGIEPVFCAPKCIKL